MFEIFFDSYVAINFVPPEPMVARGDATGSDFLDSFAIVDVYCGDPKATDEPVELAVPYNFIPLVHRVREIAFHVECSCSNVNIDHQLAECRSNRRVEAFPRLKGAFEWEPLLRKEEAVKADRNGGAPREMMEEHVHGGDEVSGV